jgi:hypothetical protein
MKDQIEVDMNDMVRPSVLIFIGSTRKWSLQWRRRRRWTSWPPCRSY